MKGCFAWAALLSALLAVSPGPASAQWKTPAPAFIPLNTAPAWPAADPSALSSGQPQTSSIPPAAGECAARRPDGACVGTVVRYAAVGAVGGVFVSVALLPVCVGASVARGGPACNNTFVIFPALGAAAGLVLGLLSPACRER